jgi:hypothetical protein
MYKCSESVCVLCMRLCRHVSDIGYMHVRVCSSQTALTIPPTRTTSMPFPLSIPTASTHTATYVLRFPVVVPTPRQFLSAFACNLKLQPRLSPANGRPFILPGPVKRIHDIDPLLFSTSWTLLPLPNSSPFPHSRHPLLDMHSPSLFSTRHTRTEKPSLSHTHTHCYLQVSDVSCRVERASLMLSEGGRHCDHTILYHLYMHNVDIVIMCHIQ